MRTKKDPALCAVALWAESKGHLFESVYPWGLTLVVAAVLWNSPPRSCKQNMPNLLSATISVAAIMAGFFATAKAILLSLSNEDTVKQLRKDNGFQRLVGFFWTGIRVHLLTASYAAIGFFFVDKAAEPWFWRWFYGLELLAVLMAATSYRAFRLLATLLRLASSRQTRPVGRKGVKTSAPLSETVYAQDETVTGPPLLEIDRGDYEDEYPSNPEIKRLEGIIKQMPVDGNGYPVVIGGECKAVYGSEIIEGLRVWAIRSKYHQGGPICYVRKNGPMGSVSWDLVSPNIFMTPEDAGEFRIDRLKEIIDSQPQSGDGQPLWVGRKGCAAPRWGANWRGVGVGAYVFDIVAMRLVNEEAICTIRFRDGQASKKKASEIFSTVGAAINEGWRLKFKAEKNAIKNDPENENY